MGLLAEGYYKDLAKKAQTPASVLPPTENIFNKINNAAADITSQVTGPNAEYIANTPKPLTTPGIDTSNILSETPVRLQGDISAEKQISRFGGEVGSPEYYKYKAENPLKSFLPQQALSSFGLRFPDQETWDKMSRLDQASHIGEQSIEAVIGLIAGLPREIVKTPIRYGLSVYQPWANLAKGESTTVEALAEKPVVKLPWLGAVPTYWQTYDEAKKAGAGPLAATLTTGGVALGDATILGALSEAMVKGLQPRTAIKEGEPVKNTGPIQNALIEDQGKLRGIKKRESSSEYYSLPKTTAKDLGGGSGDTFLKITPAGADSIEISVVQTRSGVVPKTIDYIKGKFGNVQSTYAGDFGPEIKLQSQIVKTPKTGVVEALSEEASQKVISSIPPKALKGFENKAITGEQINNLGLIGKVNGIEPGIQDVVMRTLTGKKSLGELTQAEYVKTAQTLASFNEIGKYAPDAGAVNIFSRYGSPQRYWMRTYEEKTGLPLYSDAYVPMEEAVRLRDTLRDSYRNQAREIFGEYAKGKYGEERRLIKNYMEGDRAAITENSTLTPQVKSDLVKIADQIRPLYDKLGQQFGISTEVFLKDYQPHVQDLGGVYQLYKEGQNIPKQLEFFSKFKRRGSIGTQIDDALALFDIYTNAGSNSMFVGPVLERVAALGETLPNSVKNSLRSYIQEKMGYAGPLEEYLNNVGTNINKRLGTNIPPDVLRQLTQIYMDTTYAGAMGLNPGTVFRNGLQYDLMAYPRLGPEFYGDALKAALSKEGMAEVRNSGFLVGAGEPYGQALTQDVTIGGSAVNLYRKGAQSTLQPFSMVEGLNRARTYFQTKFQFNDALAKYNSGKYNWSQFENKLGFDDLSPVDRNVIRQRLISGDTKGAFEAFAREIIDETQFPYRKGASSRITYGLTGKIGTQFAQWNIEFVHTLGNWIKQAAKGNPEKLIRFAASSYAIQRSFEDALGFDFTRSIGTGPFSVNPSPGIKSAIDILNGVQAWKQGNAETLNESADSIMKTLKSLGIPAGVEIQKWKNFMRSYDKGPVGPDGQYGVYDQRGRLQYYTTFDDIFWQAFGFPTSKKEQYNAQAQELRNAKFNYSQTKQKVLELYQQEKFDEANELINEYGIKITPDDFDQYYIPFTDRTFKSLPNTLKAQFAPQLYPTK